MLIASLLLSCSSRKNYKPIIVEYLKDTLLRGRTFDTLKITEADSLFSTVYDDPSYLDIEKELLSDYDYLQKETSDYNYERNVLGGTGINKGIINLYQNRIRESLSLIENMKSNYISHFKGFQCVVRVKYSTNYGDSTAIVYIIMDNNLGKIQKAQLIQAFDDSFPLDSIESFVLTPRSFSWAERIDTTNFIKF